MVIIIVVVVIIAIITIMVTDPVIISLITMCKAVVVKDATSCGNMANVLQASVLLFMENSEPSLKMDAW